MKVLAILLTMAMLLCLAACGGQETPAPSGDDAVQTDATLVASAPASDVCVDGEEHDYVEEVLVQATCNQDGSIRRTCSKCEQSFVEEIAAGMHSAAPATCLDPAICDNCNEIVEDAKGHTLEGGVCVFCGLNEEDLSVTTPETTAPAEGTESTETTETTETTEVTETDNTTDETK